MTAKETTNTEQ